MRTVFPLWLSLLTAATLLADDPPPASRPAATAPATSQPAEESSLVRDAILKELQAKEEKEERAWAGEPDDPNHPLPPPIEAAFPERLQPQGISTASHLARFVDVDADGRPELVTTGDPGQLLVYKASSARPQKIELDGLGLEAGAFIVDLVAVPRPDGLQWLVAAKIPPRAASSGETTMIALYTVSGRRLWKYEMLLPQRFRAYPRMAAGDLDGDGVPEFVVAPTVQKATRGRMPSFLRSDMKVYLLVINAQGQRLSSREIEYQALNTDVHILPSPGPGHPGRIVLLGFYMTTYTFQPPTTRP